MADPVLKFPPEQKGSPESPPNPNSRDASATRASAVPPAAMPASHEGALPGFAASPTRDTTPR